MIITINPMICIFKLFILGHGIVDGLINVRIDKNQWNVQLDKPVSKKRLDLVVHSYKHKGPSF